MASLSQYHSLLVEASSRSLFLRRIKSFESWICLFEVWAGRHIEIMHVIFLRVLYLDLLIAAIAGALNLQRCVIILILKMSKWNGWWLLTAAIVLLILCSQTIAWICEELDRRVTILILALKMTDTLAYFSLAALSWKTGASWAIHGSTRSSRVATWIAWLRQYERSSLTSWWLLEIRQKNGWIMVRNFISSPPTMWLSH